MNELLKSKKYLKFISCFLILITLINSTYSINERYLRFLSDNYLQDVKITYEFAFSCGNGYLTYKLISTDITNELVRRNLNIVQNLEGKNTSKGKIDLTKDSYFNIYLEKDDSKILLVTTNPNSKYFSEGLANYPQKFVKLNGIPRDEDFSRKFNVIKIIQERIINNL